MSERKRTTTKNVVNKSKSNRDTHKTIEQANNLKLSDEPERCIVLHLCLCQWQLTNRIVSYLWTNQTLEMTYRNSSLYLSDYKQIASFAFDVKVYQLFRLSQSIFSAKQTTNESYTQIHTENWNKCKHIIVNNVRA